MATIKPTLLNDWSGGLNLRDAPIGLAKNECLTLENMYPLTGGTLVGRGGQSNYNANTIDANPIKSAYRFYKQDGTGILIVTSGTKMYTGNDGTGVFTEIANGFTSGQKFSFTTWSAKDKCYFTNGSENLMEFNGNTVANTAGSPPVVKQIEFHQERLWGLLDNGVRFTDLGVDNVWQGAALLNISDKEGGKGTFLKSCNGLLLAGKTSGLFRFQGDPVFGAELVQYSEIGCIAPWSAAVVRGKGDKAATPSAVIFLAIDGLYITDGFSVEKISGKIDPLFTAKFSNAVGAYYQKRQQYWFSFNPLNGTNDTTYVATKIENPRGDRIAWSKYTGFNIETFAHFDGGSDNGDMYIGLSNDSRIRRVDTGSQDANTDYTCRMSTHNIDFGDPGITKSVRWLKATFSSESAVGYILNYFDQVQSSGSLVTQNFSGMLWDVDNWDVGAWGAEGIHNTRTSTLGSGLGRRVSITIFNSGDGDSFQIHELLPEARLKEKKVYDLFTLNQTP